MTREELTSEYGLTRYPFDRDELVPPKTKDEPDLYARVDGFANARQKIDETVDAAKSQVNVMVHGPEGCGRSSIVNYIIHRARPPEPGHSYQRFQVSIPDHRDLYPLQLTFRVIRKWMRKNLLNLLDPHKEFFDDLEKCVVDSKEPPGVERAEDLFTRCRTILAGQKLWPALIFENVRTPTQFEKVIDAFQDVPVVLFTATTSPAAPEVRSAFFNRHAPDFVVDVTELKLEDVTKFLEQRFETLGGGGPHPFDPAGVEEIFGGRGWSFKTTVNLLGDSFDSYAGELAAGGALKPRIPVETLRKQAVIFYKLQRPGEPL